MFSGIIQETGKIATVEKKQETKEDIQKNYARITITSKLPDLVPGSSVAVNGVCQTVVSCQPGNFVIESLATTLEKTNMGALRAGELVNLESSLKLGDSIDGHMVQGHVQGTAIISEIQYVGETTHVTLELSKQYMGLCVPEGSIALDGVSLTVASIDIENNRICVSIIPYTLANTNIQYWKAGQSVNVECDIIGRYVVSLLKKHSTNNVQESYLIPNSDRVQAAIEDLKHGKTIIVFDNENRENEGDFIVPAANVNSTQLTFLAREGCGLICQAITQECADRLKLEPMVKNNTSLHHTAFTVSIDATQGTSTGISANDRALTARLLASPTSVPEDFSRPGHIFPIVANPNGIEARAGHTEAAIELMDLAGHSPSALICEILKEDGSMARLQDLMRISEQYNMQLISIADILEYKRGYHENTKRNA